MSADCGYEVLDALDHPCLNKDQVCQSQGIPAQNIGIQLDL